MPLCDHSMNYISIAYLSATSLSLSCTGTRTSRELQTLYSMREYIPANTLRSNNVVIMSKRRHFDVITSKWRRFDVMTTLVLRHDDHYNACRAAHPLKWPDHEYHMHEARKYITRTLKSGSTLYRYTKKTVYFTLLWPHSKQGKSVNTSDLVMMIRWISNSISLNACQIYFVECVSKIKHIHWGIHHAICGAVRFQFTHFPCESWENIYTFSYYHHQIGSMNYYSLFRARSWNNGVSCMSLYILLIDHEKTGPCYNIR